MIKKRLWPLFLLPVLLGLGCGQRDGKAVPPSPNIVASYNGGVITKDQLKGRLGNLMPCCVGRYQGKEGTEEMIKEIALPAVISRAIKQKKIDLRQNIREEMGNLTDKLNMSFLHFKFHEQILDSDSKYDDLKESYDYQKRILEGTPLSERYNRLANIHAKIHKKIAGEVKKVSEKYLANLSKEAAITKNYDVLKIEVTDDELKDFYWRHKEGLHGDEYRIPEKVKVQEIVVKVEKPKEDCPTCPEEKERKAREAAESALIELQSGADLQTVAKTYASDPEAPIDPRWIARGAEGEWFDGAVFSMNEGEIGIAVEEREAVHVVKVLEKRSGRFKSYDEVVDELKREYRWQKGEDYLNENRDRILFSINARPYTIGDFIDEYDKSTPPHECHHLNKPHKAAHGADSDELCDLSHNDLEEQKRLMDQMVDRELIVEDTYDQMIHVEHKKEIEFLTMASLYPLFHKEEMENLIHVTDEMVEEHYEGNRENYKYPAMAKISMILIRGGETEEQKRPALQKANKAYEELNPAFFSFRKAKNFAEVARMYSEDEMTASKGGRLDVDIHECRDAVEYVLMHGFHKKIFELDSGDISDVFEYGGNYYIVKIDGMENRKQVAFEEIREQVRTDLMSQEHEKVMEKWEDNLLRSAGFEIYDEPFKQVLAEVSAEPEQPGESKES